MKFCRHTGCLFALPPPGFPAGQVVAVKVRHPGVADTILRDFSLMMAIAGLSSQLSAIAHLRIEDTLKQFAAPLTEQVRGAGTAHGRW